MGLTNKTKCLIKDLELQIDFLIGYKPSGLHWKQEWSYREKLIEEMRHEGNTPQEIIDKLESIQNTIIDVRDHKKQAQPYFTVKERIVPVFHDGRLIDNIVLGGDEHENK